MQPLQEQRVDGEEVAGDQVVPVVRQEGSPGAAPALGRGRQAVLAEDALDRRPGDAVPHLEQFALDLPVAPRGVLARQAHDERDTVGCGLRSPQLPGVGKRPPAPDDLAMPAEQGGRGEGEGLCWLLSSSVPFRDTHDAIW